MQQRVKNNQKSKNQKAQRQTNVVEALKDVGSSAVKSFKDDLLKGTSQEVINQILGRRQEKKYSGDLEAGESLDVNEVLSGKYEENQKIRRSVAFERTILDEEKSQIETKRRQLMLELHALSQEVLRLAQSTQELGEQTKIAAIQAPVNPGIYHLVFFEKLIEFIVSFRKKIDSSVVWLKAQNKRSEKKNYWAMYKKKGSSFLLSPEHYLQRSAG